MAGVAAVRLFSETTSYIPDDIGTALLIDHELEWNECTLDRVKVMLGRAI